MTTTVFSGLMNDAVSRLSTIEAQVLQYTKMNLLQKVSGVWTKADDDLFAAHTTYCFECWNAGVPDRASWFWESVLSKETAAADNVLQARVPPERIHKGAPFFNTGRGYLLAGNLDKAVAFISEAGNEEALRNTGSTHGLLLGDHGLTENAILKPLVEWMDSSHWETEYTSVTTNSLDLPELKGLITWLCSKPVNAVQLVVSLLRLRALDAVPRNDAVRHLRVQILADLLLIIESSIRSWQAVAPSPRPPQLHARLQLMLTANPTANTAFLSADGRFSAQFPRDPVTRHEHPDKETAIAVNWVIADTLTSVGTATSTSARAGIVCHLMARLRNSLMHVIDDSLDLYSDDSKFQSIAGLILAAVKLSQCGQDGSLSTLPTT